MECFSFYWILRASCISKIPTILIFKLSIQILVNQSHFCLKTQFEIIFHLKPKNPDLNNPGTYTTVSSSLPLKLFSGVSSLLSQETLVHLPGISGASDTFHCFLPETLLSPGLHDSSILLIFLRPSWLSLLSLIWLTFLHLHNYWCFPPKGLSQLSSNLHSTPFPL